MPDKSIMKKAAQQYGTPGLIVLASILLSGQINNLGNRIDRIAERTNERIDRHLESAKHLAEAESDTLRGELASEIDSTLAESDWTHHLLSPESEWAYYLVSPQFDWVYHLDPHSEYPPLLSDSLYYFDLPDTTEIMQSGQGPVYLIRFQKSQ